MTAQSTIVWSTDMSAARPNERVFVAYMDRGERKICVSWWLPPQKDRPNGRWNGFVGAPVENVPYAWAAWPEPPEVK